jgi:Major Facilitator Superfamily
MSHSAPSPETGTEPKAVAGAGRSAAFRFVVLVGIVSLFADMTYEGGRSIAGPYLALLGASAAAVGFVAGGGELLGYSLRLLSGRVADITGRYWPMTIAGYAIQMFAVPGLALAGSWQAAAVLIALERTGKALRNPPRDAMLAAASREIGRGWAFGVHEGLDQIGAVIGPLAAAAVLAIRGDYKIAFALLLVPAVTTLVLVCIARVAYPTPESLAAKPADVHTEGLPGELWVYLAAVMLVAAGFADFSLMSFHFARQGTVAPDLVPVFYSAAMGASGAGSLLFGRAFDRVGIGVLVPLTFVSCLFAPLAFLGSAGPAFIGVLLWGLGMGVHESIMAAAVAGMVPAARIASAYGLFNLLYGIAWFAGSAAMGLLYDVSIPALVVFCVAVELASIPLLLKVRSGAARRSEGALTRPDEDRQPRV